MKIIGITGGIGSGKTTVANFFKSYGIPVYTADEEAKKLMLKDPVKSEIISLFGADSYTRRGALNRKYIAARVFKNKPLLNKLNKIVHPRVHQHFLSWVKHQKAPYVLYEAAILYENQPEQKLYDYSILVVAPIEKRFKRLQKRDHSTLRQIKNRMNNQWSDEQKMPFADFIIKNDDLTQTKTQVAKLHVLLAKL